MVKGSTILWTALMLSCVSLLCCNAIEYWVTPNTTVDCPTNATMERCVTLYDIAANKTRLFKSNTAFLFLPGVHYITSEEDIWIGTNKRSFSYFSNVSLMASGQKNGQYKAAVIDCNGSKVGFVFESVRQLSLFGLTFVKCGFNVSRYEQRSSHFYSSNVYATLYIDSVFDMRLKDITITDSTGFGLLGYNLDGDLRLDHCTFQYNKHKEVVPGGNALIYIRSFKFFTNIAIVNSTFAHGFVPYNLSFAHRIGCAQRFHDGIVSPNYCHVNISRSQSAGLDLTIENWENQVNILIQNCTFYNNTALFGASMLIRRYAPDSRYYDSIVNVTLDRCTFNNGEAIDSGGGIYIEYVRTDVATVSISQDTITLSNLTFNNCRAGFRGGAIAIKALLHYSDFIVKIQDTIFVRNTAAFGAALSTEIHLNPRQTANKYQIRATLLVHRSVFTSNSALYTGGAIASTYFISNDLFNTCLCTMHFMLQESDFFSNAAKTGSALDVSSLQNVHDSKLEIIDCSFAQHRSPDGSVIHLTKVENVFAQNVSIFDNSCRGIYVRDTSIEVGKDVCIYNNTATIGAGLLLDYFPLDNNQMPYLILSNKSSLYVSDNQAMSYGGGIAARSSGSILTHCFFELAHNNSEILIYMTGNTAGIAGSSIYGGNIENCYAESVQTILDPKLFWDTFSIFEKDMPSAVASQPYKVCICTANYSTTQMCQFDYHIDVYPGQTFHVPVVAVGQYNYSSNSSSVIRATVEGHFSAQLGEQQATQDVSLHCKNLTYSLHTLEKNTLIQLSIEIPFSSDITVPELQPATINATILNCPYGFELYESTQTCDCRKHLVRQGVTCDIVNQVIHRSGSVWIGNFSGDIVVHNNCPFDYCNQTILEISPYNQKEQCAFERSGVLCGDCEEGLSLVLGSSQCKQCSNVYLLLLLPIALAGLVLVVLLLKCNLTVSTGMMNGLIFYANIIQVNKEVFFPSGTGHSVPGYIFSVFIAWINLDLGIEVCFVDGLKTYHHTWFQFAFPVYIWLLVGLLIIICRYSTKISMLTGTNTISVLATLFVLSYAKLLRTSLNAFSPTTITDQNDTEHLVWLLDGNYRFLHWPHLALFLASLITLLTHLIPFTVIVILGPTLQAHIHHKMLTRWFAKLNPILDAYQGPYKTKYRYWTGLMLLVRVFLFAVFAGNALGDPNINLLTILLTVLVLIMAWVKIGTVYRRSLVNALELFYLFNIEVTVGATLYIRNTTKIDTQKQAILTGIMVGSALIGFIGTISYHCYSEFMKTRKGRQLKDKVKQTVKDLRRRREIKTEEVECDIATQVDKVKVKLPTMTVVTFQESVSSDTT